MAADDRDNRTKLAIKELTEFIFALIKSQKQAKLHLLGIPHELLFGCLCGIHSFIIFLPGHQSWCVLPDIGAACQHVIKAFAQCHAAFSEANC